MNHTQEHLQRDARACYKRKDYKRALELFNRAVGRAASVQLLDNRAACYEKLDDLPAALKDAKKAIQLQREDPTGYLRAGKILVKMEKQSVALEIYTHGLKAVKHIGQGYELLRKVHGVLLSELSPPKSVDPLTVLPRELAEFVLEHLTFQQRINACLVTKQWAEFIRSTPHLWQHLDLSDAKRKVRSAFISRAINTAKQRLTAATLGRLYDFDKALVALLRHCPLEELVLLETGLQSSNLVEALERANHLKGLHLAHGTEIGPTALAQVIAKCAKTLVTLDCSQVTGQTFTGIWTFCHHLEAIAIRVSGNIEPNPLFGTLSEFTPNLRSLVIHAPNTRVQAFNEIDLSKLQNLEALDVELPILVAEVMKLPPTIISLRLATTHNPHPGFFDTRSTPPRRTTFWLPRLQKLSIDVARTSVDDVASLLSSEGAAEPPSASPGPIVIPSKLHEMSIRKSTTNLTSLGAFLSDPRLQHLTKFKLQPTGAFGDEHVQLVVDKLPKLQTVDFSETEITGVGVKCLVEQGHIRHLLLNDCRFLSSDAADWARSQGVRVDYRMMSREHGGKKLRY